MIGQCQRCGDEEVELHVDASDVAICNVCMKDSHGKITHPLYEIFKHAKGSVSDHQGRAITRRAMVNILNCIGSDGNPSDFGSK